jgi:hypothetical protein
VYGGKQDPTIIQPAKYIFSSGMNLQKSASPAQGNRQYTQMLLAVQQSSYQTIKEE